MIHGMLTKSGGVDRQITREGSQRIGACGMIERLADLDALVLSCHNHASRTHIREAIVCYRAGAFRSATVAAWHAVVYDLIAKMREMVEQGDTDPQADLESLRHAQQTNCRAQLQSFEDRALTDAHEEYGLLSSTEVGHLKNLY